MEGAADTSYFEPDNDAHPIELVADVPRVEPFMDTLQSEPAFDEYHMDTAGEASLPINLEDLSWLQEFSKEDWPKMPVETDMEFQLGVVEESSAAMRVD